MIPWNRALRLLLALALSGPGPAFAEEVAQAVVAPTARAPAGQPPPPEGVDEKWLPVREAFARGAAIEVPKDAKFDGTEEQYLGRIRELNAGCKLPCKSAKAVEAYKKSIRLVCAKLKLDPAEDVVAVYCPKEGECRKRGADGKTVEPDVLDKAGAGALAGQGDAMTFRAQRMAEKLLDSRKDDLDDAPVGGAAVVSGGGAKAAPVVSPYNPAGKKAEPPPQPAVKIPGMPGIVGQVVQDYLERRAKAFAEERGQKLDALAKAAGALLDRPNGDKAVSLAIADALRIEDAAVRADTLRKLLAMADRALVTLLGLKLKARVTAARKEACAKKKGAKLDACLKAEVTEKELTAARDAVFAEDPELGLYFVGRSEYQVWLQAAMGDGLLAQGASLEPWETGVDAPKGTTVVLDSEAAADKGKPYLGLRITLPDGSSRFEGSREVEDGVERLVLSKGVGGESLRMTFVSKPGSETSPLRSEETYLDANGRKVRVVKTDYKGALVQAWDFNKNAKDDGDFWRYEKVLRKDGKLRREVRDADAGYDTVLDYDGSVTITARREQGYPLDGSEGKRKNCSPANECWVVKKGRMVATKSPDWVPNPKTTVEFKLEEIQFADGSIMRGATDGFGQFRLTEKELGDCDRAKAPFGHCTLIRGKTDDYDSTKFDIKEVIETDGKGKRQDGDLYSEFQEQKGGKRKSLLCQLELTRFTGHRSHGLDGAFKDEARAFNACAGHDKDRDLPLSLWLDDLARRVDQKKPVFQDDPGYENHSHVVSKPPFKELGFVHKKHSTRGDGKQTDGDQYAAEWGPGTEYKSETPPLVLKVRGTDGLPHKEYLLDGKLRVWGEKEKYSSSGWVTSGGTCVEQALYQYRRSKMHDNWEQDCGGTRLKPVCSEVSTVGDCVMVKPESSILGGLAGGIGELPVIKQAGDVAKKAYYTIVGGWQENLQLLNISDGVDNRAATISNLARGVVPDSKILDMLKQDKEVLAGFEEKVYENRRKSPDYAAACTRLQNEKKCDELVHQAPVSDDERLAVVKHAYSPGHAVDYGIDKGKPALVVLGALGQAGEIAAASLPVMGLGAGLGTIGKMESLGGWAAAARWTNGAVNAVMTTGWVVGGVANAGEFAHALANSDYKTAVKTGVQAVTDLGFAGHMGKQLAGQRKRAEAAREALAKQRQELQVKREALKKEQDAMGSTEIKPAAEMPTVEMVTLDLRNASPADLLRYGEALKAVGAEHAKPLADLVSIGIPVGKGGKFLELLSGTGIEPITVLEAAKRSETRKLEGVAEAEVDAAFAKNETLNDHVYFDLRKASKKDVDRLRAAVGTLGGKWNGRVEGRVEVEVPSGKGKELAKEMSGTGAAQITGVEYSSVRDLYVVDQPVASADATKAIDKQWSSANGSEVTSLQTIAEQRQAAIDKGADPTVESHVALAEASGDLAFAEWSGRQSQNDCVVHALANSSNGIFTHADVMLAARRAGYTPQSSGITPPQLGKMLVILKRMAASRGQKIVYKNIPVHEFFKAQDAAAAAGGMRRAGLAGIRTGIKGEHSLHAVAVRGSIRTPSGETFIIVVDSNVGSKGGYLDLAYTPEAFGAAVVSEGFITVELAP